MSLAAVLPFPRAARVHADLGIDETLRRVRVAARVAGCGAALIAKAEGYARGLLKAGHRPHAVIEAATSFAKQQLSIERGPTQDGAA